MSQGLIRIARKYGARVSASLSAVFHNLRSILADEIHTEHTAPSTYYVGVSYISKVIAQTYIMGAGHFICQRTYMPFTLTPCSIWLPFLWHAFCTPSLNKAIPIYTPSLACLFPKNRQYFLSACFRP